ncbi:Vegetative incompatibility protein HET-E-1 [Artemisia annua]|uniref:Vegetative incompatibility protein HET-E-1 n=1 Tax=Artemisia annua TaxID=35608 RepID=A0A2U1N174_ARTAN|nr:Vegetative incompatibility protein HET-E-1 [Artemisia annua]
MAPSPIPGHHITTVRSELVVKGDWDNLEKYLAGFIRVVDNHYSVKMLSEFLKQKYIEALDKNERAKALDILNEELKVLKPFDGELFSDMTNLLMIENISLKWQHQLCQNPNSDPDITSILVDHSCGPQNAAQGQVHVANEFSSIRRSGGLQLVDGSVSLMNVEAQAEQMALGSKRREHTESLSLTVVPKKPRTPRIRDSRVLEYSRPLNPAFEDRTSDQATIGYAFRRSNFFMMARLPEGLCPKLVAGMIGENVSIAAKIKNTKLTTAKEELETWDSILKAFELLGMKVGFLRDRKHLLATFLFESEAEPDWNVLTARYKKWKKNNFTLKFIIKG